MASPKPLPRAVPAGAVSSIYRYAVPFFDTDAMGIVHHANYIRYLELARVKFLAEHDRPYGAYLNAGFHVAVVGVQAAYHKPSRFADELDITCWLSWARSVSVGFGYVIHRHGELVLTGRTDHAVINDAGRPVRIPAELRDALQRLVAPVPAS